MQENTPSLMDQNNIQAQSSVPTAKPPVPAKIDGARRMGVTFNPGKDPRIDELKQLFAQLHDKIEEYCGIHAQTPYVDDSIARAEIGRSCATSLTHLQTAKMYAVEGLTR